MYPSAIFVMRDDRVTNTQNLYAKKCSLSFNISMAVIVSQVSVPRKSHRYAIYSMNVMQCMTSTRELLKEHFFSHVLQPCLAPYPNQHLHI